MKNFVIVVSVILMFALYLIVNAKPPTAEPETYNPYLNARTPWRSSGIPHTPMTFRPDNPDKHDYGSQNIVFWDLEKTKHYFPYRSYKNYGMYEYV